MEVYVIVPADMAISPIEVEDSIAVFLSKENAEAEAEALHGYKVITLTVVDG